MNTRACVFLNSLSRSVMWPNRCLMTLVKAYVAVTVHEPSKFGSLWRFTNEIRNKHAR